MKKIIDDYIYRYKQYKQELYNKLFVIIGLFGLPFIPTIFYYDVSLFIRILFWTFLAILLIALITLFGLILFIPKRPMFEFLYKDIIDEAFKDDYTHYEYESFPSQSPFYKRGNLFNKADSELIKYRLTFYYSNNRIDLYSLYTYLKTSKSPEPIFDGIYYVFHNVNHSIYKLQSHNQCSDLPEPNVIPAYIQQTYDNLSKSFKQNVYISGINNEVHIAINQSYDYLEPNNINEDQLQKLSYDIWELVKLGRKLYRDLESSRD